MANPNPMHGFKPGNKHSVGRPNGSEAIKVWRRALNNKLKKYNPKGRSKIEDYMVLGDLAEKLIDMALEGNMEAFKEIGNRIDGKSTEHKVVDKSVTYDFGDLSKAAGILEHFAGGRIIDGDARVVQDRPVLLTEVRAESDGCGETVDIPENQGSSGRPE